MPAPQPAGAPDAGYVPYVLVDQVNYGDKAPWPSGAVDGGVAAGDVPRAAAGRVTQQHAAGSVRAEDETVSGCCSRVGIIDFCVSACAGKTSAYSDGWRPRDLTR